MRGLNAIVLKKYLFNKNLHCKNIPVTKNAKKFNISMIVWCTLHKEVFNDERQDEKALIF